MEEVKFDLELQSPDSQTEILEFYQFLRGEVPGLKMELKENPNPKEGAMSAEILPVIQMALGSTVVAAVVNGIFAQVKDYFEFRRQKKAQNSALNKDNKSKENSNKENNREDASIVVTRETKDGTKEVITINKFTDEDRKQLFEFLSK